MVKKAYIKIRVGEDELGQLDIILYDDDVPKTVNNFVHYLEQRNTPSSGYLNSMFHRIIRGFMLQGGDFLNGDGTGSTSIYNGGKTYDDENFLHRHTRSGILRYDSRRNINEIKRTGMNFIS